MIPGTQMIIMMLLIVFLGVSIPSFAWDDRLQGMGGGLKGIGGMGGGFKGIGGMGGGFKGVGGMGGGFKGIGGMGGGMRGVGDAGGGFSDLKNRYYSRYGEYSTRYGENNPRYGGTPEMNETTRYGYTTGRYGMPVDDGSTTTRYGVTTGRYGMPVDENVDNSFAARYNREEMYGEAMQRVAAYRQSQGNPPLTQGYMFQRMRELEAHPPTSFNTLYLPSNR